MRNGLLISAVTWPHLKGNKVFQVADALEGSQMHWKIEKLVGTIEPFGDIDPLISESSFEQDDSNMLQIG